MYSPKDKDKFIKDATNKLIEDSLQRLPYDAPIRNEEDFNRVISECKERYWRNSERNEDSAIEIEEEVLGCYRPMHSPGIIELDIDNLTTLFENTVFKMIVSGYLITYLDYRKMAEITIRKTFYHEYFHHFADIQQHLFGFIKAKETEEALAVAWSRMKVNDFCMNPRGKYNIPAPIYETFLRKIYNYVIPGYRDWKLYMLPEDFAKKVAEYMLPTATTNLVKNGVNIGLMILNSLDLIYETSDAVSLEIN